MKSSILYPFIVGALILSYPIYNLSNKEIESRREQATIERKELQAKAIAESQMLDESRMYVYSVMTPNSSNSTKIK